MKRINIIILLLYLIIGFVFLSFPIIQNKITTSAYTTTALRDLYQTEKVYQSQQIIKFIYPLVNPLESIKFALYAVIGETQALNIYPILIFAIAGLGTYLIAYKSIRSRFYSFLSGFSYAVLSLYFLHVELVAIIPFFAFFLLRFCRFSNKLNLIFILATLIFVFNLRLEDVVFVSLFVVVFIAYYLFQNWRKWDKKILSSLLIIFAILVLCIASKVYFNKSDSVKTNDPQLLNSSSVDLVSVFMPFQHLFFKNSSTGISILNKSDFSQSYVYFGFLPLIIIIYAFWLKRDEQTFSFWKIFAICFLILSLGPYLKIGDSIKSLVPLPYLFFYRFIPIFDRLEDIRKLYILAYFPMTILLAVGLKGFIDNYGNKKIFRAMAITVICILGIELSYFPSAEFFLKPNFIKNFSNNQEQYSIVYLFPSGETNHDLVSTYIAGVNLPGKKILSIPFAKQDTKESIFNRLLFYGSFNESKNTASFIATKIEDEIFNLWDQKEVKYVILNKKGLDKQILDNFQEIFNLDLKLKESEKEDDFIVYQTKKSSSSLRIVPGSGWTVDVNADSTDAINLRQRSASLSWESNLEIINSSKKERNIFLEFSAKSDDHRFLTLSRDGEEIKKLFIGPENQAFRVFFDHLKQGKTTIFFSTQKRYLSDQIDAEPKINFSEVYYEEIKDLKIPSVYQKLFSSPREFKIWQTPFQGSYNFSNNATEKVFSYDNFLDLVELSNDSVAIRNADISRVNLCSIKPFFAVGIGGWDFVERNYDIFDHESFNACGEALFNRYNIKYLIIEKKFIKRKYNIEIGIEYYKIYIRNAFPSAIIDWEDDNYIVFQFLDRSTFSSILVNLREGFGDLAWDPKSLKDALVKMPHRQVYDGANIELVNISSQPLAKRIKFSLLSTADDTRVKLLLNEKEIGDYTINSELQAIDLPSLDLVPGANYLAFQLEKGNSKSILYITQFEY